MPAPTPDPALDAEGTPWITPVEYACDRELRFDWVSGRAWRMAVGL